MQYKLQRVGSDRLFFDLYRYTACIGLEGASALRGWRCEQEQDALDGISKRWAWRAWRNQYINLQGLSRANRGGSWQKTRASVAPDQAEQEIKVQLDRVMTVFKILRQNRDDIKATVSLDMMYVYCNDLAIIDALAASPGVNINYVREVDIDRPRDVLLLNQPTHSHRSYFREKWLPPDQSTMLRNWLLGQHHIRLGPSLGKWVHRYNQDNKGHYIPPNWFIDHDNRGELLMLEMVSPRLVRKTLEIHKR